MALSWADITTRYGVACFLSPNPTDPEGDGDVPPMAFDDLNEARDWAERALRAGRFQYIVIYDGRSGIWETAEDLTREDI